MKNLGSRALARVGLAFLAAALVSGTASSYITLSSGTAHSTEFTRSGSTTPVHSQDRTLTNEVSYTVVAYG